MTGADLTIAELMLLDSWEKICSPVELAEISKSFSEHVGNQGLQISAEFNTVKAQIAAFTALMIHHPTSGRPPRTVRGQEAMLVLLNLAPLLEAGFGSVEDFAVVRITSDNGYLTIEPVARPH